MNLQLKYNIFNCPRWGILPTVQSTEKGYFFCCNHCFIMSGERPDIGGAMSKWNGMVYKFLQEANNMLSDTELHALLNLQIMEQGRLLDLPASETLEKSLKASQ